MNKIKNRGFASMSPEKRHEISSKGGKMAHVLGLAHKFNSETGRRAGIISARVKKEKHGKN